MPITAPNRSWFHIRYAESAPRGLPSVFLADQVICYSDDSGTWYAALWRDVGALGHVSSCILRVAVADVCNVSEYADAASAAARMATTSSRSTPDNRDAR